MINEITYCNTNNWRESTYLHRTQSRMLNEAEAANVICETYGCSPDAISIQRVVHYSQTQ